MSEKYDVVIIGAGPGGYVAAIKAGQAGLKVACIDKAELGGICLNWGCIPTKAFLKSAEVFQSMKHAADYGLKVKGAEADLAAIVDRSRNVSGTMTQGIEFLFKKNGVTHIQATATIVASNLVEVTDADGTSLIETDKVIISTGASPVKIPIFPVDEENIITYRQALAQKTAP
jgi:dihydrolipoamide dehydrogenase